MRLPVGFAPTYKLLEEAWDRFCGVLPAEAITRASKAERSIRLATGGSIDFWTLQQTTKGKSVAGRGRKYMRVFVDEAAMSSTLEQDWHQAIRPTLTDLRGDAWFASTPHGRNGFYRLWLQGEQNEPGWRSWTMPTSSNPVIDPDEIEEANRNLPDDAYQQEYLAAFLADAANPFGLAHIDACTQDAMAEGPIVCWGFDLAKHTDWTVGVGLNAAGDVAAFQRWQSDWRDTLRRVRAMIGDAPAYVDKTGVGDAIVEELTRHCSGVQGYTFTNASKQVLFEGLAVTIQNREIRIPAGILATELESFIYEFTPSGRVRYCAAEGCHDDCADALALAVQAYKVMPPATRLDIGREDGTPAGANWWSEHIDNDDLWD